MSWWKKVTEYKRSHPAATPTDCFAALSVPAQLQNSLKPAVYQALRSKKKPPRIRKAETTAAEGLKQFKASRKRLKAVAKNPPFTVTIDVSSYPVHINAITGLEQWQQRLIINTQGIEIIPDGKTSADRVIPWVLLETLQSFSTRIKDKR